MNYFNIFHIRFLTPNLREGIFLGEFNSLLFNFLAKAKPEETKENSKSKLW